MLQQSALSLVSLPRGDEKDDVDDVDIDSPCTSIVMLYNVLMHG